MSGLNKLMLIGHLGQNPDVHKTADGKKIVSFSLATSESWRDKATGERKERTEWHRVVIFDETLAGVAEQYLKKGSKAWVVGQSKTRKYKGRDGVEKQVTECVLAAFRGELTLLDRADRAPAPSEDSYGTTQTREPVAAVADRGPPIDDDIPF
jgi:single-strand DNA-binding protein